MATIVLTGPPDTAALFRRAALGALPVPGAAARRGDTLPADTLVLREVAVDRTHLAAYDRVCGFRLTDALPATYPHVLAFPLALRLITAAEFPFPVVGLVHVTNRVELRRPIDADERMDLSVRVADLRPHDRGRQFDVIATATVGGDEVWRGVSTYLRKERDPADRAGRGVGDRPAPPAACASWRLKPGIGTGYAAVSGDHNPIHTSRLGARLFGFARPIAHGMWSKARCLAALEGRLPEAFAVTVDFKASIPLPSTVAFSATASADGGWAFALRSRPPGQRQHLAGAVTPTP